MFIRNIEKVDTSKLYRCGKIVSKFLQKKGIFFISIENKEYIYAKNNKLQKVLSSMPFYIRFLLKVGVING